MKKIIFIILATLATGTAFACTPINPTVASLNAKRSIIITSPNKHYFLKLVPSKWALEKKSKVKKRDAYALAFEAMPDGQIKPLWSFKHWEAYSSQNLHLSNNGMNLVAYKGGVKSNTDTSAVTTFKRGKKVRGYSPNYFGVRAPIRRSTCGTGSWLDYGAKSAPFFNLYNGVTLQTINGLRWTVSPENLAIRRTK